MQKTVNIAGLGALTVSSLKLPHIREWGALFAELPKKANGDVDAASPRVLPGLLKFMPLIWEALRPVHQDLTFEALEAGLTLFEFNALYDACEEVSGLRKAKEEIEPDEGERGEKPPCRII